MGFPWFMASESTCPRRDVSADRSCCRKVCGCKEMKGQALLFACMLSLSCSMHLSTSSSVSLAPSPVEVESHGCVTLSEAAGVSSSLSTVSGDVTVPEPSVVSFPGAASFAGPPPLRLGGSWGDWLGGVSGSLVWGSTFVVFGVAGVGMVVLARVICL